ncbi:MAG: hypothetical protein IT386_07940 [Deltaproteobacteria bacterium]|nr:hypothetical protein [Deltaproteobacteria bacterium]
MTPQQLLEVGERGIHLLFETQMIEQAFGQDGPTLRRIVETRLSEVHRAAKALLELDSPDAGRSFVAGLPLEVQHVLVLLYFELLDDRIRDRRTRH